MQYGLHESVGINFTIQSRTATDKRPDGSQSENFERRQQLNENVMLSSFVINLNRNNVHKSHYSKSYFFSQLEWHIGWNRNSCRVVKWTVMSSTFNLISSQHRSALKLSKARRFTSPETNLTKLKIISCRSAWLEHLLCNAGEQKIPIVKCWDYLMG